MNRLLKMSFDKMGYTYDFLTDIHKPKFAGKYLFQDEDKLVLALKDIHDKKLKIVVLPDFDIDGISSGVISYSGLSLLGFNVELYRPDVNKGYGFDCDDIDAILKQWPDTHAILTCDVGITCNDAIVYAQSKDVWVYVTDHHIEKIRSTADAIVDPSRNDSNCDFNGVCGAYMIHHVLSLYASMIGNEAIISLIKHLSLFVSLGSCGDLMPVVYDTRLMIKDGIAEFNRLLDCDTLDEYFGCSVTMLPEIYVAPFDNLRRFHFWLLRNGGLDYGDVTDVMYGFTYCPMFNSVKRMGESLQPLYDMFFKTYEWGSDKLTGIFSWLWDLNKARKDLVNRVFIELVDDDEQALAPYMFITDTKPGVLGLLAIKLMGLVDRPCMVLIDYGEYYSGSGRTPAWFSGSLLGYDGVTVSGHEHAFGITIDKSVFVDYAHYLHAMTEQELARIEVENIANNVQDPRLIVSVNSYDCYGGEYDFSVVKTNDYDVCVDYTYEIDKFRPFGNGFPEPEFLLKFTNKDIREIRVIGSDKNHLRIDLEHNIRIIYFNGVDYRDVLYHHDEEDYVFCVSGKFSMNEFNGSTTLQFMVSRYIC